MFLILPHRLIQLLYFANSVPCEVSFAMKSESGFVFCPDITSAADWAVNKKVNQFVDQVMDTPGLHDTEAKDDVIAQRITCSLLAIHPGPHAVILCLSCDQRFTREEVQVRPGSEMEGGRKGGREREMRGEREGESDEVGRERGKGGGREKERERGRERQMGRERERDMVGKERERERRSWKKESQRKRESLILSHARLQYRGNVVWTKKLTLNIKISRGGGEQSSIQVQQVSNIQSFVPLSVTAKQNSPTNK